MDIRKSLDAEHSKSMTDRVVRFVGDDQKLFDELFRILSGDDDRLAQRASWPLGHIGEQHPQLIKKHLSATLDLLRRNDRHDAVPRNLLKVLQFINVPEKYCGELLDICYLLLKSELQPIAVRAYAITAATRICKRYPELKGEFHIILNELNDLPQSPGIRVRVRKAVKELQSPSS